LPHGQVGHEVAGSGAMPVPLPRFGRKSDKALLAVTVVG
jgi:hypothetical protein